MDNTQIEEILLKLTPAQRIKFLRQKILNQNQETFCKDGIIRSGTLKSIETERMKIGSKIAERLVHKFNLEGIICEINLFLHQTHSCKIKIDTSKKELIGNSMSYLEEIRQKITQLTPIKIDSDAYAPQIPSQSTLLAFEAAKEHLFSFSKTLCLIKGSKSSLFYLTYLNENELLAEFANDKIVLSTNIINFCTIFVVEIIYLNNIVRSE